MNPEQDQDPRVQVGVGGRSFWDWVLGSHSMLKTIGIVIVLGVVLYYLSKVSIWIPVLLLVSFALCSFVFKSMFFKDLQVPVIACDEENPAIVDILMIGKDRFKEMTIEGNPEPLSTSSGDVVYVADDVSADRIKFSWVHETSRFFFIRKAEAFDSVKELAESSTSELYRLKNIPQILGLITAGKFIRKYEEDYDSILSGDSNSLEDRIDEDLRNLEKKEEPEDGSE